MSGDIVNLRQARKARMRSEKEREAAENRRLHGRTKAEKQQSRSEAERLTRHLAGHRLGEDATSDDKD